MHRIKRIALLGMGLVVLATAASADSNCRQATGSFVEAFNPATNSVTGAINNSGWLDGTTVAVFNSAGYPTPVPTEVTFTSTFSLTTNHGQLNGSRIYVLDLVTGQGVSMVRIDGASSTGRFAGATGVLFLDLIKSTSVAVGPYYEMVGGQICFKDE